MILSIKKAVDIMNTVADNGSIGLAELSRQVGMPKSTVYKIAQTLEACGVLYKEPSSGEYLISYRLFRVGYEILEKAGIHECAFPVLKKLHKDTQQTVSLSVMDDNKVLYIEKLESPNYNTGFKIGGRGPLHCTASGRVMLASFAPKRLEEILAQITPLEAFAKNMDNDVDLLLNELKQIRVQGYVLYKSKINPGVTSIATCISEYPGREAAAISIAGPLISSDSANSAELIEKVLNAGREISANFNK